MNVEKPLFILKPNLAVAIIPTILGAGIAAAFLGLFAGFFLRSLGIGITVGVLIFVPTFFFRIMNLKARQYLFYKDKAEFYEGFFNIVQRTVQYNKVTDCVLTRTVWDRIFGTGTIRLVTAGHIATPAHGGYGMGGGIGLQYLENSEEVYQKVQALLHSK